MKKRMFALFDQLLFMVLISTFLLISSAGDVLAEIVYCYASADSFLSEATPTTEYGDASSLLVGTDNDGTLFSSLIRFDLSEIPEDAIIEDAKLQLYRYSGNGNFTIQVVSISGSILWEESTVNYDNAPTIYPTSPESYVMLSTAPSSTEIDVTSHVNNWIASIHGNYGFGIRCEDWPSAGNVAFFYSRAENSGQIPSRCPRLVVTYSIPDDNYEENDTIGTSFDLTEHEGEWLSNIDGLGVQSDDDWYEIFVDSSSRNVVIDCTFKDSDGDIDIELYNANGDTLVASASTSDNESIDYIVPSSGYYYIKVYLGNASNKYDLRWQDLEYQSPTITLTSPNGGEEWEQNSTYNITWNSSGTTGSDVLIKLVSDSLSTITIASSTTNDGSYSWEISTSIRTSTDYRIYIESTSDDNYHDFSDLRFSIIPDSSNHPPVLSNGYVNPDSGDTETYFYWYVDYDDEDLDPPSTASIVIPSDSASHQMSLESGTSAEGTYKYGPRTLGAENHSYYFVFSDGQGGTTRLPVSGEFSGPLVSTPSSPDPPTNVDASDGTYNDRVLITWFESAGATSYKIVRGTSSNAGAAIGTAEETSYEDTSVIAGTTYYYWVVATNSVGDSGLSAYDTGYRSIVYPGIPTNLHASQGTYLDMVKLTFARGTNTDSTMIYRGTTNDPNSSTLLNGGVAFEYYNDTTAAPGKTYYYWARGSNYNGTSDFSEAVTGWRGITGKPDLVVEAVSHNPQSPASGDNVTFTVIVKNQGTGDLGSGDADIFQVGFFSNHSIAPVIGDTPDEKKDIDSLLAGDSKTLNFVITAPTAGNKRAWAYVDSLDEIDESDENNNSGPTGGYSWTVIEKPDDDNDTPPTPDDDDDGGGGGGGGGVFGNISLNNVLGYHFDWSNKDGIAVYMPVTKYYKALKGAQTHVEGFAPGLADFIRGRFDALERKAKKNPDGSLSKIGTDLFPALGKVAEIYLEIVDEEELSANAYSKTTISIEEYNKLHREGKAISSHVVKIDSE